MNKAKNKKAKTRMELLSKKAQERLTWEVAEALETEGVDGGLRVMYEQGFLEAGYNPDGEAEFRLISTDRQPDNGRIWRRYPAPMPS